MLARALQAAAVVEIEENAVGQLLAVLIGDVGRFEVGEGVRFGHDPWVLEDFC